MSRRNRPAAPERPTGTQADTRSDAELAASVRRKLFFILIAFSAIPISITLSYVANRARESAMTSLLPEGVTLETPVKGPQGPTVRDALARVGASPNGQIIADYEGRPILFRQDGKDLPYKEGTIPEPEGDEKDTKSKPRIVEVD